MTGPIAFNPSSSLIASILPQLEEAGNPESAKDSVRYPAEATFARDERAKRRPDRGGAGRRFGDIGSWIRSVMHKENGGGGSRSKNDDSEVSSRLPKEYRITARFLDTICTPTQLPSPREFLFNDFQVRLHLFAANILL